MEEFVETDCAYCGQLQLEINLNSCMICDRFERACGSCMDGHRTKHTPVEVEQFRREMTGEPQLTIRERLNEELKEQIRRNAEVICKALDDREALAKKLERQSRELAEELDRRTLAS